MKSIVTLSREFFGASIEMQMSAKPKISFRQPLTRVGGPPHGKVMASLAIQGVNLKWEIEL